MSSQRVRITVTLDCGHDLTYYDSIAEKYPFWCPECGDYCDRTGKCPWSLATEIVPAEDQP